MKRFFSILLILTCVIFSLSAENVYSIGTSYIFFNEYSSYKNVNNKAHLNGIGLDFSYKYFNTTDEYNTDFDINADDGSFFYTNRLNFKIGFWYSLNVNFPFYARIYKGENMLFLSHKENSFWTLIMDNICGITFSINPLTNFFVDASIGPKIGFFYINYEDTTNLTFGIASEFLGRYFFENSKNPDVKFGISFGTKLSYDFYSIVQAYYPQDYSRYGVFSVTPFISFVLKN